MTKEEKKERRRARHELEQLLKPEVRRRGGLFLTRAQLKANAKILADRTIKGEHQVPFNLSLETRAEMSLAGMVRDVPV
jgi:hypothetical protein